MKNNIMTENKYNNGKIYKIINNIDDEFYVGSTIQALHQRKAGHKRFSITKPNQTIYQHLNNVGWDNVDIILIENYLCNSIEELKARERYWIETLKPSLNKIIPLRTIQEWREQNKDKLKEKQKEYREQNKERIAQKKKEYFEKNKEQLTQYLKEYYKQNKEQLAQKKKEYREQNKTQITQYKNKYYEQNKEKLSEKIKCECGCEIRRASLSEHKRTKKHQKWLNSQVSKS
jgi:hypothetical protein